MSELEASKALFFRHLPKTAGTSLITTLSNVFGESHCHRFVDVGEGFREHFSDALTTGAATLSLVTGHIPLGIVEEGACGTEFTVLREPIARLLSMRRFFEGLPAAERTRLGFGDRLTIAELLASRQPEIYGQVRHGLTRFFCGSASFADPTATEYWDGVPAADAIDTCRAVLNRMTVGIVEDMPTTLRRLGHVLRVPYDLEVPMENATSEHDDEVSPHDIRALVEVNTADIAAYHLVRKQLSAWSPSLGHVCGSDFDPRTVFDPQPGEHYEPQSIPGRQGFAACSPTTSHSWLGPTGRGRIYLAPSKGPVTLLLVLYGVVPHYPMDDIVFSLDGHRWARSHRRGAGHSVYSLATIPPHAGPVELAIVQPFSVPVPLVTPESLDKRTLGVALARVVCEAA
jgi:hypothetical protein